MTASLKESLIQRLIWPFDPSVTVSASASALALTLTPTPTPTPCSASFSHYIFSPTSPTPLQQQHPKPHQSAVQPAIRTQEATSATSRLRASVTGATPAQDLIRITAPAVLATRPGLFRSALIQRLNGVFRGRRSRGECLYALVWFAMLPALKG